MILVHTCCTTCALNFLTALRREFQVPPAEINLYYANPNIHPESEWHVRRQALQETMKSAGYKVMVEPWKPKLYFDQIKNLISQGLDPKNKQLRCPQCYRLRLQTTFAYAADHGFESVSTTMLASGYLDRGQIRILGEQEAKKSKIQFLVPTNYNCQVCQNGYYKQNYCGCIYSLEERYQEKFLDETSSSQ
jgi:predicted adenine nucleotide alpha hydrolase (AANH) superfamily ATPase